LKVDYGREPRMDFEVRKKKNHMKAEEFVKEMKEIRRQKQY